MIGVLVDDHFKLAAVEAAFDVDGIRVRPWEARENHE